MTKEDINAIVERAAENSGFKFLARLSMIIISLVVIPLGSYIGSHSLSTIDDVQKKVVDLTTDLRVLTAEVRTTTGSFYRSDDARRDFQLRDLRIDSNKDRIDKLDRTIEELRQSLRK